MREVLRGALLALVLCALTAGATEPAVPEPAAAESEPEPAAEPEVSEPPATPLTEVVEAEGPELLPGYEEVQGSLDSTSDGDLTVSINQALARPARGYLPLEVTLHNAGSVPRGVLLVLDAPVVSVSRVAVQRVEVGARQRVTTWLLVPASVNAGIVHVESPGLSFHDMSFYSMQPTGRSLLVLGAEEPFKAGTALSRQESGAKLVVRFLTARESAPRELAAYVGYSEVVVAGDVTALPADVWSALESYAATGGVLTLLSPPRDVAARLPLLAGEPGAVTRTHGFGSVRLCTGAEACGQELLAASATRYEGPMPPPGLVQPAPPPNRWGYGSMGSDLSPLLPGVRAPVGQLLGLVTLFVLLVGPGGLMLARRKGPLVLLIAVPAVSLATCLAIIAWSVLIEGFELHAAHYSITRLDRARDRALTAGLGAYYANLEPEAFQVPVLGALLTSDQMGGEARPFRMELTRGMRVTEGFLSPRTYQEWGEVALSPSRVRLVVRSEGKGLKVLNALGAPLVSGIVHARGAWWSLPALAEGAEGLATSMAAEQVTPAAMSLGFTPGSEPGRRLAKAIASVSEEPLPEGHFIARLDGLGPTFTRTLPTRLYEGMHLVRGRVDAP